MGAGLYMYDVVVKMFTFAISSTDEFLSWQCDYDNVSLYLCMDMCVCMVKVIWCNLCGKDGSDLLKVSITKWRVFWPKSQSRDNVDNVERDGDLISLHVSEEDALIGL